MVDQDAQALRTYLSIRGLSDGEIARTLARVRESGRKEGVAQAIKVLDKCNCPCPQCYDGVVALENEGG